jgi:ketosteroid isomerase-like protein
MSQRNVEIVLKHFEDTNARRFGAVMEAYAGDVELVMHGDLGLLGHGASGKAAVGEWFGDWFRQFDRDYRFEIEEVRAAGERVFLMATHHGRGREGGVPVEECWAYVYTVRGDGISRVEIWSDRDAREEAMAAAGVSE